MRRTKYVEDGRTYVVELPDGVGDDLAYQGILIGPPNLDCLDLPADAATRLHNELYVRGILTYAQAKHRRQEVFAALQSTFKVDVDRILNCYYGVTENNGKRS